MSSKVALASILALFLTVIPLHHPLAAPKKTADYTSVLDKDWVKTFELIKNHQNPVAQKLVFWLYATETTIPVDSEKLIAFAKENPHWPRLHIVRKKAEQDIIRLLPAHQIVEWFDKNPPATADGLRAYMQSLIQLGKTDSASKVLSKFWHTASLNKNETSSIASAFKKYFNITDHATRLDNMIWQDRMGEADTMLAFVDADVRALGHARIALAQLSKGADAALQKVPRRLLQNEGLLYERMRYRRRKNNDAGALEMLRAIGKNQSHPDKWWQEIHILARREIEKRDYRSAYNIILHEKTTNGFEFAQAKWLLGWLELRHLNQPQKALANFDALYRNVQAAVSKSRAAYWAARAAEKIPDAALARQWDGIAAQFISTFYGQLSHEKAFGGSVDEARLREPMPDASVIATFEADDLVRALRLLHKAGLMKVSDPFFAKLISQAKTRDDYYLTAKLAHDLQNPYYAIEANKQIQQNLGQFLLTQGYPRLPGSTPNRPEKALIHAIVQRESMFKTDAQSHAGARGLMQLMPATAKQVSKKSGLTYNVNKLTADPSFNVRVGSEYLASLVDRYNGFYPMAIAAYNAGPGRVDQWISMFGDPRKGDMNIVDWIEHIPIYETRNYVQRVMETYFIYKLRFGEKPKTISDFH